MWSSLRERSWRWQAEALPVSALAAPGGSWLRQRKRPGSDRLAQRRVLPPRATIVRVALIAAGVHRGLSAPTAVVQVLTAVDLRARPALKPDRGA